MSTIVTRSGKGSPLTNTEVDANFTNLNTGKAELSGAVFTGAITTNSTIDGRDVATDGTKLDGVEASADVTDTANVTAAGALMDSELTSIASVKALNQGVASGDSPTFVDVTATSLDISGNIDVDGVTNLDVVDIDGAVDMASTLTVGSGLTVTNGSSLFNRTHSTTTASLQVLNLKATSSGDMANGFGPSIVFGAADTGTTSNQVAEINVVRAGSDTAFNLELQTADATRMTIGNGGVDVSGVLTANAGVVVDTITIDGSTITSSASLTLDLVGNLTIDVDGTVVSLSDGGVNFGQLFNSGSGNFNIYSPVSNQDMIFRGNDGGSGIVALTLDMSNAGAATFNAGATFNGTATVDGLTVDGAATIEAATGQLRLQGTTNTNKNLSLLYNESGDYGQINCDESGVNQKDLWVTGLNLKFGRSVSSESMRIDSSGNVGISTTAPLAALTIGNNSADGTVDYTQGLVLTDTSSGVPWVHAGIVATGSTNFNGNLIFATDGNATRSPDTSGLTERMRIGSTGIIYVNGDATGGRLSGDGSGGLVLQDGNGRQSFKIMSPSSGSVQAMTLDASSNLLVGTTSTPGGSTDGTVIFASGTIASYVTSAPPAVFSRNSSNGGDVVVIQQQGTTVGSIGNNTDFYIASQDGTGVRFSATQVLPCSESGATQNGSRDLGSSGARFKDLYLSGGVYLGGTGAANKLSDFETGSWTPTIGATTNPTIGYNTQSAVYTKVGNLVSVTCKVITATRSGGSGQLTVDGLPFTVSANVDSPIYIGFNYNWTTPPNGGSCQQNTTHALLYSSIANNVPSAPVDIVASGNSYLIFSATYRTNS